MSHKGLGNPGLSKKTRGFRWSSLRCFISRFLPCPFESLYIKVTSSRTSQTPPFSIKAWTAGPSESDGVFKRRIGVGVALGWVSGTCQMSSHGSYQVSCLPETCHCEQMSSEQILCDSEDRGLWLNRNHPEVGKRGRREWALSPQGWPVRVRGGSKVDYRHWGLISLQQQRVVVQHPQFTQPMLSRD